MCRVFYLAVRVPKPFLESPQLNADNYEIRMKNEKLWPLDTRCVAMDMDIERHCRELNRCNQRGGRMLSMLDLIDAETVRLELAALLMAACGRGASFMAGARPGGAGKTTVMCAMLNLLAPDFEIIAATGPAVRSAAGEKGRRCYVCHEIGSGPWFAYLWGADLRAYCALSRAGHMLATNLHADGLEEARDQICRQNGAPDTHFHAFHLAVFLRIERGGHGVRRWISKAYASDGAAAHRLVYDANEGIDYASLPNTGHFDPSWIGRCRSFLEKLHAAPARTIEDVRARVLDFFQTS